MSLERDTTITKRQFKKLRRQIRADIRQGTEVSINRLNRLIELDDWLATNTNWRRNYGQINNESRQKEQHNS
jgi:hypothetical protein